MIKMIFCQVMKKLNKKNNWLTFLKKYYNFLTYQQIVSWKRSYDNHRIFIKVFLHTLLTKNWIS